MKCLFKSSADTYAALLVYWATPLENWYSPAQFVYGRQLKAAMPITIEQRHPKLPDTSKLMQNEELLKIVISETLIITIHPDLCYLYLSELHSLSQIGRKLGRSCMHQAVAPALFPLLVRNLDEIDDTLIPCPRMSKTFWANLQELTHPTQHLYQQHLHQHQSNLIWTPKSFPCKFTSTTKV